MASVELRRVSKVYHGGVTALLEVDLEVRDGELLVLVGPNGSGKSTILRLIAGLEHLTAGEILVGGKSVNGLSPKRRDVTMMFQGCVLYPHLSAERNIAFGLDPDYGGLTDKIRNRLARLVGAADRLANWQAIRDRVRRTAQLLGVEQLLDRYPRQLSGGERQRIALGRALVRHPAVFLLDEPLSQADVRSRQRLQVELRRVQSQSRGTMIVVTHDHVEAIALADRLAVIDQGRVHQVGTPAEILDRPRTRFVAEFIGHPPMNFVAGSLQVDGDRVCFQSPHVRMELTVGGGWITRDTAVPGRSVWLGFRPDAAALLDESDGASISESVTGLRAEVLNQVKWGMDDLVLLQPAGPATWDENAGPLVIRAGAGQTFSVGDRVEIRLNRNQLHWFDRQTGQNLREKT